jgi:hypothetical protein
VAEGKRESRKLFTHLDVAVSGQIVEAQLPLNQTQRHLLITAGGQSDPYLQITYRSLVSKARAVHRSGVRNIPYKGLVIGSDKKVPGRGGGGLTAKVAVDQVGTEAELSARPRDITARTIDL